MGSLYIAFIVWMRSRKLLLIDPSPLVKLARIPMSIFCHHLMFKVLRLGLRLAC
jgi:hypothetical protein